MAESMDTNFEKTVEVNRNQITKAEIARLADIAKREQVMVEMEFGGRIVRVSPVPAGATGGAIYVKRGGVML